MGNSTQRRWDLDSTLEDSLLKRAWEAQKHAYAPYSNFKVGAALLTKNGKIYTGSNVENASYGLTICAERVALFKAVSEGEREFKAIAIVTSSKDPIPPCGACRQVLAEFSKDLLIVSQSIDKKKKRWFLNELLPESFEFKGPGGS
mgnify:CR=1 FL=1